jgi:hypothetical protein
MEKRKTDLKPRRLGDPNAYLYSKIGLLKVVENGCRFRGIE